MKSKILARKIDRYDLEQVENFVRESVTLFNETRGLFRAGQNILLKPNLLRAASPEKCVTTHPIVLEAAVRVFRDMGMGRIAISDSPSIGSVEHAARCAGYEYLKEKYDVRIVPLTDPVPLQTEENVPHLKIAGSLQNYDHIINLPKVKSHQQMTVTLAIKNMFGCVIGKRKPVLHCLVQNDKVKFGRMLIDIARQINPALTIVDGIQAMEGNGPISGTPYPLGLMIAGQDMIALEKIIAEILVVPSSRAFVLQAAREKEYGAYQLDRIELIGETDLKALTAADFHLANFEMDISFNPLKVIKSVIKNLYQTRIREKFTG